MTSRTGDTTASAVSLDDRARWVRTTLDVDHEADEAAVERAILERLEQTDFVPPPAWDEAMDLHAGNDVRPEHYEADREDRLRTAVDEYADAFFGLPIDERHQQWGFLRHAATTYPALAARLDALQPGLSVDASVLDDEWETVRELGQLLCRTFTAYGHARATVRRQGLRRELTTEERRAATRRVREVAPDLVRLSPETAAAFARGTDPVLRRPPAAGRTRVVRPPAPARADRDPVALPWWIVLAVVPFALFIARGIFDDQDQPSRPKLPLYSPSGEHSRQDYLEMLQEARRRNRLPSRTFVPDQQGRTSDGRLVERKRTLTGGIEETVDGRRIRPEDGIVVGELLVREDGRRVIRYTDDVGVTRDVPYPAGEVPRSVDGRELVGVHPLGGLRRLSATSPRRARSPGPRRFAEVWEPGVYKGRTADGREVERYVDFASHWDLVDGVPQFGAGSANALVPARVERTPNGRVLIYAETDGRFVRVPYSAAPRRSDGAEIVPLRKTKAAQNAEDVPGGTVEDAP